MTTHAITDPAAAAAAGICVVARLAPSGHLRAANASVWHPSECLWCPYPTPELTAWIDDFWRSVKVIAVTTFERLPTAEQRARVHAAQYGETSS